MAVYSINDIEKLTGVKAHTLRIWEKRYDILPNRRTNTNIRFYLDEDLQQILNIALLNKNGLKISKIAQLDDHELKQKISQLCEVDTLFEDQIDALMHAIFEFSEFKFLKILNHEITTKGFEKSMEETIFPLLDKLSMMWIAGSIKGGHENFVNNIIRNKLIIEINKLPYPENGNSKFLLFLPEFQNHEMSLLYVHFILKKYGADVLNLGTNLTLTDLADVVRSSKPKYVFTIINDEIDGFNLSSYIQQLATCTEGCKTLLMGYQLVKDSIILPSSLQLIDKVEDLKKLIDKN